jgi:hypothetical protein
MENDSIRNVEALGASPLNGHLYDKRLRLFYNNPITYETKPALSNGFKWIEDCSVQI